MFTVGVRRKHYKDLPKSLKGPRQVKIGFPSGKADGLTISKAIWNEFGTRGGRSGGGWGGPIPERPFMRNAIRGGRGAIRKALATSARKLLRGDTTLTVVMNKLGEFGKQKIQDEISSMTSPPNSPVTIALKGSSHPLIDTGEMRSSVTYQVK